MTVTLYSLDPAVPPDIPALLAASAALAVSGLPFMGPIGAARVGYHKATGEFLLNPSNEALAASDLNLVVAGTKQAVLMVESEAQELPEAVMLKAVTTGHEAMCAAIESIEALAREVGRSPFVWTSHEEAPALVAAIESHAAAQLEEAYSIMDKLARQSRVKAIRESVIAALCAGEHAHLEHAVQNIYHDLESRIVRGRALAGKPRIDGRDTDTVRHITIDLDPFPRCHGSVVFTRGETQALVMATLGTEGEAQRLEDPEGDRRDEFMLHYNFPPFSVGEVGPMTGPKRREIGHGRLAKRAICAVLPKPGEFPYVLRIVSDITESNGSSSMATVCGSSLALMCAGVPIRQAVAGIAMGLIKEGEQFVVLTDILGDEDHLGDMDFKVAGTAEGVTALQMDIKIQGITSHIMEVALEKARAGRLHILGVMNQALSAPRIEVSVHAPRIITFRINPEKIRDVIGKGGSVIREITESTGATVDISDDGVVKVAAVNGDKGEAARSRIEQIACDIEVGKVYDATVVRLMEYGAFVALPNSAQGLVHVSQISEQRVENVADYLQEGQKVRVKVLEFDRQGRMRLSMRDAIAEVGSADSVDQPT